MKKLYIALTIACLCGIQDLKSNIIEVGLPMGTHQTTQINNAIAQLEDGDTLSFSLDAEYIIHGSQPNGFNWDGTDVRILRLENLSDITILGNGSTLVGKRWGTVWFIRNCINVKVRDLHVTWYEGNLPYIKGQVLDVSSYNNGGTIQHYFDILIPPPYLTIGYMPSDLISQWDNDDGRPATDGYFFRNSAVNISTEKIDDDKIRVPLAEYQSEISVGDWVMVYYRKSNGNTYFVVETDGFDIKDCTLSGGIGRGIYGMASTDISIKNVEIIPKPGYDCSMTAAATRFYNCRGKLNIRDSKFYNSADDGINVHSKFIRVETVNKDKGYIIFTRPAIGNLDLDRPFPEYTKMRPQPNERIQMSKFDSPFEVLETLVVKDYEEIVIDDKIMKVKISFQNTISGNYEDGDYGISPDATPSDFNFINNEVKNNKGRGIIFAGQDAYIRNSTFTWNSGPGILLTADASNFYEAPAPKNVVVYDCLIDQCNIGAARRRGLFETELRKLDSKRNIVYDSVSEITDIWIRYLGLKGMPQAPNQKGYILGNTKNVTINDTEYLGNLSDRLEGYDDACFVKVHRNTPDLWNPHDPSGPQLSPFVKTIQAEDFDFGGETFGYHDISEGNSGNYYRPNQDVDIWPFSGGHNYFVGKWFCGEWLNYSFNAPNSGNYNVTLRLGENVNPTLFHLEIDNNIVPGSWKWQAANSPLEEITVENVNLSSGNVTIKVVMDEGGGKFDWIRINELGGFQPLLLADNPNMTSEDFSIFPNPTFHAINFNRSGNYQIIDINGMNVLEVEGKASCDISKLRPGIYMVRNEIGMIKKMIKH